jgi:hypothetical protein
MKTIKNCCVPLLRNRTRRKASSISIKHETGFKFWNFKRRKALQHHANLTAHCCVQVVYSRKESFMLHMLLELILFSPELLSISFFLSNNSFGLSLTSQTHHPLSYHLYMNDIKRQNRLKDQPPSFPSLKPTSSLTLWCDSRSRQDFDTSRRKFFSDFSKIGNSGLVGGYGWAEVLGPSHADTHQECNYYHFSILFINYRIVGLSFNSRFTTTRFLSRHKSLSHVHVSVKPG